MLVRAREQVLIVEKCLGLVASSYDVVLNGYYQFRFHYYKIPNTLFGILYLEYLLFGILVIWNACYLEYSHTLLVSLSFTGFTHYLYTTDSQCNLEQSITSHSTRKRSTRGHEG